MLIDPEEILIEDILGWFPTLHSTMWGETFTITDDDRAVVAAKWFRDQMIKWADHVEAQNIEEDLEGFAVAVPEPLFNNSASEQTAHRRRVQADHDESDELDILITSAIWPPPGSPLYGTGIGNPAKVTS